MLGTCDGVYGDAVVAAAAADPIRYSALQSPGSPQVGQHLRHGARLLAVVGQLGGDVGAVPVRMPSISAMISARDAIAQARS